MGRRRPVEKKVLTGVIFLLITCISAWAQITSSTANHVDTLSYPVSPDEDQLFVFYQINQVPKLGTLSATLPGSANYNFEWSKYNPDTDAFDAPFSSDAGIQSSTVSDLLDGGYRVRIWDGTGTDTTMFAWVMLDHLLAQCEKTSDDKINPVYKYCGYLQLSGTVSLDTFTYYDPVSHVPVSLHTRFSFKWTSDNDDLRIPNDTIVLAANITYLPPTKNTWYILTATDNLGMKDTDSVLYESIETKAKFTVEYMDKVTDEFDAELTGSWSAEKGSQDAMLTVQFLNESENGESYEWVYLDTLGGIKQGETTYTIEDMVEYTYETADEYYYPYLVSVSDAGCIDTFRLEGGIFVVPSQLVIPNVFSPNGDIVNDFWVFKHQSLQYCKVTIMDRTGKIVYRRKIDNVYDWDGWDGNVNDSNRKAPEGQYYYVVEATGYDGVDYSDPNIIENWKLNRGNKNNTSTGGTTPPGGQDDQTLSNNLYTGWLYLYRTTGAY